MFEYLSIFSLADVAGVAGRLHFKLQGDACVQQSSVLVREVFDQTDWPALKWGAFGTDKAEDTRQAQQISSLVVWEHTHLGTERIPLDGDGSRTGQGAGVCGWSWNAREAVPQQGKHPGRRRAASRRSKLQPVWTDRLGRHHLHPLCGGSWC